MQCAVGGETFKAGIVSGRSVRLLSSRSYQRHDGSIHSAKSSLGLVLGEIFTASSPATKLAVRAKTGCRCLATIETEDWRLK